MRKLIVAIALLVVAFANADTPKEPVKQVAPLSEVVILECDKFLGAVIVLPDGTLESTTDEKAARVVYNAVPDGHVAIVRTGRFCGPVQST